MPAPRDSHLLVKVARMYFEDGASQQQIADTVGVSRSNVSRMLAAAREHRIVEIRINDPAGRDVALEAALRERFGLADVRVASHLPGSSPMQRVGELGADWLRRELPRTRRVALSWGTSLQALVWAVADTGEACECEVVPLVGGLSSLQTEVTGEELVRELARRLGASYRYLYAPAVLQSPEALHALLAEGSIADGLTAARGADVALVGIGAVSHGSSAALVQQLHLDDRERHEFASQHPVGDICARFFDSAGEPVEGAVHDRVLAVTLDDLREIPTVAGIAVGVRKAPGVLGALSGGLIDVLICDAALARALLTARDGERQ